MAYGNTNKGNASGKGGDRKKSTPAGKSPGRTAPKPGAGGERNKDGFSRPKQAFSKKKYEKKEAPAPKPAANPSELRLNKYISNAGVCSRRDADIYIQSGNVKVNGKVITEMGYRVQLSDKVEFDGKILNPEPKEYILLNKPKNFSTSGDAEKSMRNVMELVRNATGAKIQPIGRMDATTTGLLIFTNDTELVRKFAQPNQKSFKIYQVSLDRNLKFEDLEKISEGVTLDGHRLYIDEISYIEGQPKTEIGLKLRTPNVKVVRAIFEQYNYDVLKVDRVAFAGLTKKNLPRGNWRFLTAQEVINLKNV
ncbi:pseudouridylate synthase [Flavobacterium cyanobacteriorum]|uniref:Pseudouridylate synthase n=1 Tax=Flavobacterium cyanobacteriorum TaxID=2022802 RepID=A0A255ZVW7_9FLAO|nr:pseudouridine synthase [Flavobacterium cyanobacteriorum]OYQ45551.1 pseudouridylate synthase [Flavobacterium cyanobacteriorum]